MIIGIVLMYKKFKSSFQAALGSKNTSFGPEQVQFFLLTMSDESNRRAAAADHSSEPYRIEVSGTIITQPRLNLG